MKRIVHQVLENQKGKVRTWRYSSGSNSRKLLTLPGPWNKGRNLGLIKHRLWEKSLEEPMEMGCGTSDTGIFGQMQQGWFWVCEKTTN